MRKIDKHRRERITTESAELSRQAYYVRSLAGHDKDQILLQCGRRGRFVLICDGGTRGLKQMKQKNPTSCYSWFGRRPEMAKNS